MRSSVALLVALSLLACERAPTGPLTLPLLPSEGAFTTRVFTVEKARGARVDGQGAWRETGRSERTLSRVVEPSDGGGRLLRLRADPEADAPPGSLGQLLGELELTVLIGPDGAVGPVQGFPEFASRMDLVDPRLGLQIRNLHLDVGQRAELVWQWEALRGHPLVVGTTWSRPVDLHLGEVAGQRRFDLSYRVESLDPCPGEGAPERCATISFESGPPPDLGELLGEKSHAHGMPSGGAAAFVSVRLAGRFHVGIETGQEWAAVIERQALSEAQDVGLAERLQRVERSLLHRR